MGNTKEKTKLLEQIEEMAKECSEPNWNGYGSYPINSQAVLNAEIFVQAIPDTMELPECCPEPDGSVSLDWIFDRSVMLSVSVSYNDILAFAWLNNDERGHGTIKFDGKQIPEEIIQQVLVLQGKSANPENRTDL